MTKAEARKAVRLQNMEHRMKQFSKQSLEKYGSYAYEAGYLGSMVREMFSYLTPKQQELFLQSMTSTVEESR